MYQKVTIHGLVVDPITERPILVLKVDADDRVLPIWIGHYEANAIALQLENINVPRPMTHDLVCGILSQANLPLKEVLICDLRDNTYFADLVLMSNGQEIHVDARPSDAVALAVRSGAPILVEDSLFERMADSDDGGENTEQVLRWLEKLTPEELGHYEM
jgi:bifunctional DNase/RNase